MNRKEQEISDYGTEKEREAMTELKSHVVSEYLHGQIELHLSQFFDESLMNIPVALVMARELNITRGHVFYVWHKAVKKKLGIKL